MKRLVILFPILLVSLVGCGEAKYPVGGKVVFDDGKPVPLAVIIFEEESGLRSGVARADENGVFESVTFDSPGDGIPAGAYKVVVKPPSQLDLTPEQRKLSPGGGWGIDGKYQTSSSTELMATVPLEEESITLKITKKASRVKDDEWKAIQELNEEADRADKPNK